MILRSSYKIKLYSDMFWCQTPTIIRESALYRLQHCYCKLSYNARAVRSTSYFLSSQDMVNRTRGIAEGIKNHKDTTKIISWKLFWQQLAVLQPCHNNGNFIITHEVRISPHIGVCVYVTPTFGIMFRKQFYIKMHGVKNNVKFNARINLGK